MKSFKLIIVGIVLSVMAAHSQNSVQFNMNRLSILNGNDISDKILKTSEVKTKVIYYGDKLVFIEKETDVFNIKPLKLEETREYDKFYLLGIDSNRNIFDIFIVIDNKYRVLIHISSEDSDLSLLYYGMLD